MIRPPSRELDLSTLKLATGKHEPNHTFCVMEAAAYIAGEPWSDHPKCVSPAITSMAIVLNDRMSQRFRDRMVPLIPKMLGTAGDGRDIARRYIAADRAIRIIAALALAARLPGHAAKLRALDPIKGRKTVVKARDAAYAAYAAAAYTAASAYAAAADADAAAASADASTASAAYAAASAAYAADAADASTAAAADAADAAYAADAKQKVEDAAFAMMVAVIEGSPP